MDYYHKYLKYKHKYIKLKNQIASGKSYKIKKLIYKKKKIKMPIYLKKLLSVIKYGSQEIPIIGNVQSLINVSLSTESFYKVLMSILKSEKVFKKLLTINFKNGPNGVKEDYDNLWIKLTVNEKEIICSILIDIFDKLKTSIEDWISTIPQAGPAAVIAFELLNVISFNGFSEIFEGLPPEAQELFTNPENIRILMNQFINYIYKTLNVKKPKHYKGGGILKSITSFASDQVNSELKETVKIADKQFKTISAPWMKTLKALGLDAIIVNKSIKYINKYIVPPMIKSIKIIFPLFFMSLLTIENNDCKN
jgi:hypothetical protein